MFFREKIELVREVDDLLLQLEDLKSCNAWLKSGKKLAEHQRDSLKSRNAKLAQEGITDPLNAYGGFRKIQDKNPIVLGIGGAIVGLLSVLMKKMQAVTRLCTIGEPLFGSCIFGIEATKTVSSEAYKNYIFCEHRSLFEAWKELGAIGTAAVGGLNYNEIETL